MKDEEVFRKGFYYQIQEKIVKKIVDIRENLTKGEENKYTYHDVDMMTETMRVFGAYADFMFYVRDALDVEINKNMIISRFSILSMKKDLEFYSVEGPEVSDDFIIGLQEKLKAFPEYYREEDEITKSTADKFKQYHDYLDYLLG